MLITHWQRKDTEQQFGCVQSGGLPLGAYNWEPTVWGPTIARATDFGFEKADTCWEPTVWGPTEGPTVLGPTVWGLTVWGPTVWGQVLEAEMPRDGNIRVVAMAVVTLEVAGNSTRSNIST